MGGIKKSVVFDKGKDNAIPSICPCQYYNYIKYIIQWNLTLRILGNNVHYKSCVSTCVWNRTVVEMKGNEVKGLGKGQESERGASGEWGGMKAGRV